jgi:hypothetical protein
VFGGLPVLDGVTDMTDKLSNTPPLPQRSRHRLLATTAGLLALFFVAALVAVRLWVFDSAETRHGVRGGRNPDVPAKGAGAPAGRQNPCEPKGRVLEVARRAVGPEYRPDAAPRMDARGEHCEVVLWRLPKVPGGYRVVTINRVGDVVSGRPGL